VLGNVADLAFETASPGDDLPHCRSVDAVLRRSGLNRYFGIAIAASEIGLKGVRDCVDIRHGKPGLLGDLAGLGFEIVEQSQDYSCVVGIDLGIIERWRKGLGLWPDSRLVTIRRDGKFAQLPLNFDLLSAYPVLLVGERAQASEMSE